MRPYLETESLWIKSQAKIKRDALRGAQAPGGTALPGSAKVLFCPPPAGRETHMVLTVNPDALSACHHAWFETNCSVPSNGRMLFSTGNLNRLSPWTASAQVGFPVSSSPDASECIIPSGLSAV